MKTRTRELAKPGIYGTVDNPIVVSERDLREIAETFAEIKRAPVSLNGHWPDPAKPRLGNVVSVSFDDATMTLSGSIEEQDALAAAVDKGYFPDVSIGGKRRASDGKMYLHHLAYLGEEPPAVKNLIADIGKSLEGAEDEGDAAGEEIAAADSGTVLMIPSLRAPRLLLSDPAATNNPKEAPMRTLEEAEAELTAEKAKTAALTAENTKTKDQLSKFVQKYPDSGIGLSDGDPRVGPLMKQIHDGKKAEVLRAAATKFPKAKENLLVALSDSLSASASIELSDGTAKKNVSALDLLVSVFEAIPAPVDGGRLELSDNTGDGKPVDLTKIKGKY